MFLEYPPYVSWLAVPSLPSLPSIFKPTLLFQKWKCAAQSQFKILNEKVKKIPHRPSPVLRDLGLSSLKTIFTPQFTFPVFLPLKPPNSLLRVHFTALFAEAVPSFCDIIIVLVASAEGLNFSRFPCLRGLLLCVLTLQSCCALSREPLLTLSVSVVCTERAPCYSYQVRVPRWSHPRSSMSPLQRNFHFSLSFEHLIPFKVIPKSLSLGRLYLGTFCNVLAHPDFLIFLHLTYWHSVSLLSI